MYNLLFTEKAHLQKKRFAKYKTKQKNCLIKYRKNDTISMKNMTV